jgi:hypothetical protein
MPMKADPAITNFTSGELSPQMRGRFDIARHNNGCELLENWIVSPIGPAIMRPGLIFVAETKDSSKLSRLFPFKFNTEQAYVIEAGDEYFRFLMNGGQIVDGQDPYEIVSPFAEEDIRAVKFTQSADVLYMVHEDYIQHKLTRSGHTDWTISEMEWNDGPYLSDNADTTISITPSAQSGTVTLTASKSLFHAAQVGGLFRLRHNGAKVVKKFAAGAYSSGIAPSYGPSIRLKGSFTIQLQHVTTGYPNKVTIQKSYDNGSSWYNWMVLTGVTAKTEYEDKPNVRYRAAILPSDSEAGTVACTVTISQSARWGVVRLTGYTSDTVVTGTVLETFGGADYARDPSNVSSANLKDENCSVITDWTDADVGSAASTQGTFDTKSCMVLNAGTGFDGEAKRTIDLGATDYTRFVVTFSSWFSALGTIGSMDYFLFTLERSDMQAAVIWATDGIFVHDGTEYRKVVGASTVETGKWIEWTLDIVMEEAGIAMLDIWKDKVPVSQNVACARTGTFTQGLVTIAQFGKGTTDRLAYVDWIKMGEDFLLTKTLQTTEWSEGAWSDYRGFPRSTTFCWDRLFHGGTRHNPQMVWSSKTNDYENMVPIPLDDAALSFSLLGEQVNAIRWMLPTDKLLIGTSDAVHTLAPTNPNEALTPTNPKATPHNMPGTHPDLMPVRAQNAILMAGIEGKVVYEVQYDIQKDSLVAMDITELAEHITGAGIVAWSWQQFPHKALWAVTEDGGLIGCTYYPQEKVIAWYRWETMGLFEDVCCIPGADRDEVYFIVNRTIGGTTKRYIERMSYGNPETLADAFMVDSGLSYDGAPATTITGFDHLLGEKVAVLADGKNIGTRTVKQGAHYDDDCSSLATWTTSLVGPGDAVSVDSSGDVSFKFKSNASGFTIITAKKVVFSGVTTVPDSFQLDVWFRSYSGLGSYTLSQYFAFKFNLPGSRPYEVRLSSEGVRLYGGAPGYTNIGALPSGATPKKFTMIWTKSTEIVQLLVDDVPFGQVTYSVGAGGTPVSELSFTLSGGDYSNELVYVAGAEVYINNLKANGFGFNLPSAASKVNAGLPYEATLIPLMPDFGIQQGGTTQTKTKRVIQLTAKVYDTGPGLLAGAVEGKLMPFRKLPEGELTSGNVEVEFKGDYDRVPRIIVRQSSPYPATIQGLYPNLTVGEK